MTEMETQQEAIERLRGEGYEVDLWIAEDGVLTDGDGTWDTGSVAVDHVVRFEGMSNPDDEAMLLAVAITNGPRGLVTLPYGPDISGPQADSVRELALQGRAGPGRRGRSEDEGQTSA